MKYNFYIAILILTVVCPLIVLGQDNTFDNLVTDIDGNVYKSIKIGNQVWMDENLRTTH